MNIFETINNGSTIDAKEEALEPITESTTNKETSKETSIEKEQLNQELEALQVNTEELQKNIENFGGEEELSKALVENKEDFGNIFKQIKNIVYISSGVIAIPLAASIIAPEKIEMLKNFIGNIDENSQVLAAVIGSVAFISAMFVGLIKESKERLKSEGKDSSMRGVFKHIFPGKDGFPDQII